MLNSYLLSWGQMGDRRFLKPLLWSSALTGLSLILFLFFGTVSVEWLFGLLPEETLNSLGEWGSWIKMAAQFFAFLFLLAIAYFFFGTLHAAYLGLFLDDIVEAVCDRHYPSATLNPRIDTSHSIKSSTRFVLLSLSINLIASPFYLLGWFFPPLGLILQVWINGILLGKEYGYLINQRLPREKSEGKQSYTRFGILAELIWLIPVANLLAPILLCAAITHHRNGAQAKKSTA